MIASKLTKEIEVFENQRFVLTQFSCKSLLPTDRRAYSTECGKISWNTTEEAEKALISSGWEWVPISWSTDYEYPNTDAEGWSYDVDFGNFQNASGVKKMIHFVRRRRMTRMQTFDANKIFDEKTDLKVIDTCDHCDSSEIAEIEEQLTKKIAEISLKFDANKMPLPPITNSIKSSLLEGILVPPSMGVADIFTFITKYQMPGGKSSWSKMFSHVDKTESDIVDRTNIVKSSSCFEEGGLVAKAVIKKHDIDFEFHCQLSNCGDACIFKHIPCDNAGCSEVFSRKWTSRHDSECPHKIIDCPRSCGDTFPRRMKVKHLEDTCVLRPVCCPFIDIGCEAQLLFKDVPGHLDSCGQSHLLLAVNRVREQQDVIKGLFGRLNELENKCSSNTNQIVALNASAAAAVVAIEVSERRAISKVTEDLNKVERSLNDKISKVSGQTSSLQTNVTNLERQLRPIIDQGTRR